MKKLICGLTAVLMILLSAGAALAGEGDRLIEMTADENMFVAGGIDNVILLGQKVYLFGVCQQLTDSVIYLTFINEVDSMYLERKTKFLPFRADFSLQLKEYMEGTMHKKHQTATVFYSAKRKKLSKKYYKIKKRFLDNPYTKIVPIEDFKFKHPLDYAGTHE